MQIGLEDIKKQVEALSIAESFFTSAVLFALAELKVFHAFAGGPKSLEQLHQHAGGDKEALQAVLDAGVALKITTKQGDRYHARPALVDALGNPNSPAYLSEYVAFLRVLSDPILDLARVVRTGKPSPNVALMDDAYASGMMTEGMDAYARSRGVELLDRIDFSNTKTFLDLGSGPGTYSFAIAEKYPALKATLLDMAQPIEIARRIAAERGMKDRVQFIAADALTYSSDATYDTIFISNTLHMLGPKASIALLKRIYPMVAPGGRVIIQAQFLHDTRTSPRWPTLLNLVQVATTQAGRNHAIGETSDWLRQAGFTKVEHVPFSLWNTNSALIGYR
jgi:ubiquinone/menaquinone biosynthesis C-methylase UbiE